MWRLSSNNLVKDVRLDNLKKNSMVHICPQGEWSGCRWFEGSTDGSLPVAWIFPIWLACILVLRAPVPGGLVSRMGGAHVGSVSVLVHLGQDLHYFVPLQVATTPLMVTTSGCHHTTYDYHFQSPLPVCVVALPIWPLCVDWLLNVLAGVKCFHVPNG